MSYEKSIQAFIAVIKNQPQLFNATESQELKQIAVDLPTNPEEIWSIISPWLETHPTIKAAFTSNYVSGKNLGFGGSQPQPTPAQPSTDPTLPEILKNEIRLHKPLNLPDSIPSNQPPKP